MTSLPFSFSKYSFSLPAVNVFPAQGPPTMTIKGILFIDNKIYYMDSKVSLDNSSNNRKLFIKVHSLFSSAQNFETLKLYEDSLKYYTEARDLSKSLTKKHFIDENEHCKHFFDYFDNHIKLKIKILEQLVLVRSYDKGNLNTSILSKINNTSIPNINNKLQIIDKEDNKDSKDLVYKTVGGLIEHCNKGIKDLEENKKVLNNNKSIVLESTFINQNSFYIPNIQLDYLKNPNTQGKGFYSDTAFNFLEKVEEKYKLIGYKLGRIKLFFDTERELYDKKERNRQRLEKLKKSYSTLKKIHQNVIRSGFQLK